MLSLALAAGRVSAQESDDPSERARFRLGPLRFTPSIVVNSLGIDTNVFNDPDAKQDRTAAIGPATELWLRVGRSRVSGRTSGQYLYFETYENQRGWNTDNSLRWDVPVARLVPFVEGSYLNNKSRPGFEIDSRVRQASQNVTIGTALKMGRTTLTASGRRSHVIYDREATFDGANLADALNQTGNTEVLEFRYRLTALTSFVVDAQAIQDRFDGDSLRDSNSIRVLPGFEMKPSALVAGKVYVGFRHFDPLSPIVPAYRGPAASVDATFTARATQLNAKVSRDVEFSYQATQPYYTLTDTGLSITQRLTYTWDVVVHGSRQLLDFRRTLTVPTFSGSGAGAIADVAANPAMPERVDTIHQYGGSVGYRFGRTFRLGLEVNYYQRRSSDAAFREYKGLRAGASVTYGLSQ